MSIRRSLLALLAALLMGPAAVRSQDPPGQPGPFVLPGPVGSPAEQDEWLSFRDFDWKDGLRSSVLTLAADPRGYIWAGTPEGVSRYNGRLWQTFDIPHKGAPIAVYSVLGARDGDLWFGTDDRGLFRLHEGSWSEYRSGSGLPADHVGALAETVHGGRSIVWAGTQSGLSLCMSGRCSPVSGVQGFAVQSLLAGQTPDGRPTLWVGTSNGLLRLERIDGPDPVLAPDVFDSRNALPDSSVRSLAETVSADGRRALWVGTERGLSVLRDGVWTRYDAASGLPRGPIASLQPGRSQEGKPVMWAGIFGAGLVRFEEDGSWRLFGTRSGLPAKYIYSMLLTEPDSTLWVATAAGVARLERELWVLIDSRFGLPSNGAIGLGEADFPDGERSFWVGTLSGIVRLKDGDWQRFKPPSAAESPVVLDATNTVEEDGTSVFWMASYDGLYRHARGRWTLFDSSNSPLPFNWATVLLATPDRDRKGDSLWVGTTNGLALLEKSRWQVFRAGSGPPGEKIRALLRTEAPGAEPAVWVGTDKGLARYSGGRWTDVHPPCLPHRGVYSLQATPGRDGTGWLWIATRGGLARVRIDSRGIQPATCQALTDTTKPAALPNPWVTQIQSDQYGRVYLFTEQGVIRLTLGRNEDLRSAHVENVLPTVRFNRASFRDRFGRIWAGSSAGAAVLAPKPPLPEGARSRPATLVLEEIRINGRLLSRPSPELDLPHDKDSLEFQYALLSYRREHGIRFRTRLIGLEPEPTAWTREARTVYNKLPQGSYTFKVEAMDADGVEAKPIEVSFRIRPAPWRTPWAMLLYALALTGLGYGANRLRTRNLARRTGILEGLVTERTRELAEANRKLEMMSVTDPLTALHNRRFVALNLEADLQRAIRNHRRPDEDGSHNRDLLLYLIDLDHFKKVNDRAGHIAGDAVLVEMARRLREVVRSSDVVVRWGGEEFLIVSRWADRRAGGLLAARILEAVAGKPFVAGPDLLLTITCSIGWAPFPWNPEAPEALSFDQVLALADRGLYLAKEAGRNRALGVLPEGECIGETPDAIDPDFLEVLDGRSVELEHLVGPGSIPAA